MLKTSHTIFFILLEIAVVVLYGTLSEFSLDDLTANQT